MGHLKCPILYNGFDFKTLNKNYVKFGGKKISIIIDLNNIVWFNGLHITNALNYSNAKRPLQKNIDKEDKIQFRNINHNQKTKFHAKTVFINESGLYSLLINSRLKIAKKFKLWLTREVVPSIRKFGYYKLKQESQKEFDYLFKKINDLEKENKIMKRNLKKDKFPKGGLLYVIDYSTKSKDIFRIGITGDLNKRKKIYNTHTLMNHEVVHYVEHNCPIKLESCVRALLYDYQYQDNKDFYEISISKIKKAISKCKSSLSCLEQKGGSLDKLKSRLKLMEKRIEKANKYLQ